MTGTTRAALRLALGLLRSGAELHRAVDALYLGGLVEIEAAVSMARREAGERHVAARLALYLRTVLRAEAYGDGWHGERPIHWIPVCGGCGTPTISYDVGERIGPKAGAMACRGALVRWPIPLWSQAPGRAR